MVLVMVVAAATATMPSHNKLGRAKLKKTTNILVLHMSVLSIKPQQKESKEPHSSHDMAWHGIEKEHDEVGVKRAEERSNITSAGKMRK